MKKTFEISDTKSINTLLDNAEFGTLGLCANNKPYTVPINFVRLEHELFFHGGKKGKKMQIIKQNNEASFSVIEALSLLPSYFSTDDGKACPATQLFKSVHLEGLISIVTEHKRKAKALEALMQKLQKEGGYIPLDNAMYEKMIHATCVFKLTPTKLCAKFKVGQNFTKERYERVCEHLEKRGLHKDLETLKLLKKYARF